MPYRVFSVPAGDDGSTADLLNQRQYLEQQPWLPARCPVHSMASERSRSGESANHRPEEP